MHSTPDYIRRRLDEAMAEALRRGVQGGAPDDGGDGGKGGDAGKGGQGNLPGMGGNQNPPSGGGGADDAIARQLAETQKENEALKAADQKRKDDAEAAKRKAADEAAKKKGEYEPLLAKKDEELTAKERELKTALEENAQLKKAVVDRIESSIKELPEAAQNEIKLVRESLTLDKLQELVALKASANPGGAGDPPGGGPKPPAPNPGGFGGRKKSKDYQIHAETQMVLEDMYVRPSAFKTGKNMGAIKMDDGDTKFRYQGTGDDRADTRAFIGLLQGAAQRSRDDLAMRMADHEQGRK